MERTAQWEVEQFERSLGRCLRDGDFFGAFYERFVGASDVVREKFENTDINKQKKILQNSLYLMARSCLGLEDGLAHLEAVAHSHCRRRLDIAPSLYHLWLETLVSTAQEFDPEFSENVEVAWRNLLQRGIDRMTEVYQKEDTVRPSR